MAKGESSTRIPKRRKKSCVKCHPESEDGEPLGDSVTLLAIGIGGGIGVGIGFGVKER